MMGRSGFPRSLAYEIIRWMKMRATPMRKSTKAPTRIRRQSMEFLVGFFLPILLILSTSFLIL